MSVVEEQVDSEEEESDEEVELESDEDPLDESCGTAKLVVLPEKMAQKVAWLY